MAERSQNAETNDASHNSRGAGDKSDDSELESPVPHAKFKGNKSLKNEMITIEINLTDPEDLARKLEMIDLTEEETDELLRQALDLNKRLRKELNRQALLDKSPAMSRSTSFVVSAPASAASGQKPHKSVLPPVKIKGSAGGGRAGQGSASRSTKVSGSLTAHSRKPSPAYSQPSPYVQKSAYETRKPVSTFENDFIKG